MATHLSLRYLSTVADRNEVAIQKHVRGAGSFSRYNKHVKGVGSNGGYNNARTKAKLACRSSSYFLGSTDLGMLNPHQKAGKAILYPRGPRCESTEGGNNFSVDVWIGRFAMVGFVAAITIEILSGKGVLANVGVSTPAPTLALALTAVVGGVLSFTVFRSASEE